MRLNNATQKQIAMPVKNSYNLCLIYLLSLVVLLIFRIISFKVTDTPG